MLVINIPNLMLINYSSMNLNTYLWSQFIHMRKYLISQLCLMLLAWMHKPGPKYSVQNENTTANKTVDVNTIHQ